ncbi:MAG: hypothetical protein ABFD64_05965 [Armatimonadota bacterium]
MPVETRVSEDFGHIVKEIMGEDSYGKATIKTGISQAYLHAMKGGKVPSREIVEKFAKGYKTSAEPLMIAAGYIEPKDTIEVVRIALRRNDTLSEESRKIIEEVVRERLEIDRNSEHGQ